jgi:hypothetical protein
VFQGQFDFVNFTTQIHDFNPGIDPFPGGLFWTIPIPEDSVEVDVESGRASLKLANAVVPDHHSIPNSFSGDTVPPDPATLTLDIEWSASATRSVVTDNTNFAASVVHNAARVAARAHVPTKNLVFTTDRTPSTSVFAEVGRERNGVFFHQARED